MLCDELGMCVYASVCVCVWRIIFFLLCVCVCVCVSYRTSFSPLLSEVKWLMYNDSVIPLTLMSASRQSREKRHCPSGPMWCLLLRERGERRRKKCYVFLFAVCDCVRMCVCVRDVCVRDVCVCRGGSECVCVNVYVCECSV